MSDCIANFLMAVVDRERFGGVSAENQGGRLRAVMDEIKAYKSILSCFRDCNGENMAMYKPIPSVLVRPVASPKYPKR